MNTQWLKLFLVRGFIGLSVALTALTPVKAQSDLQVQVTVPFDFIVGDARFPAGDYSLRPHTTAQGVLMITNWDERKTVIFMARFAERLTPQNEAKLVFYRYGDEYFLRQVRSPGVEGYELPKSRTERSVEKDLAQTDPQRVEVVPITD